MRPAVAVAVAVAVTVLTFQRSQRDGDGTRSGADHAGSTGTTGALSDASIIDVIIARMAALQSASNERHRCPL